MHSKIQITLLIVLLPLLLMSQDSTYWERTNTNDIQQKDIINYPSTVQNPVYYNLDKDSMEAYLSNAPDRFQESSSSVIIAVPNPGGEMDRFEIFSTQTMAKGQSQSLPNVKSYVGRNISNKAHNLSITLTPQGFYGMTIGSTYGTTLINPYAKNTNTYIVFSSKDAINTSAHNFKCEVENIDPTFGPKSLLDTPKFITSGKLRRYRLAVATTVEYSDFHLRQAGFTAGDTSSTARGVVRAAIVVTMDRINQIFERDLGVTLQLIANNDQLISLGDARFDPYTNSDNDAMFDESQPTIDAAIGTANYDVGHVFSANGGGIAGLAVVCGTGKARGVTGATAPVGDFFNIDYLAHELGHQFGAKHTQSSNVSAHRPTAVEPGSGSTIMSYAGVAAPNVQSRSDAMFHYISIFQISNRFITNTGDCAEEITIANAAPVLTAVPDYTIPKNTPFKLEVNATDANGDAMTYSWDQIDNEVVPNVPMPPASTSTAGPSFRTFLPTTSPARYFPAMSTLLTNAYFNTWEVLPTVSRTLNFGVIVRDNNISGGQVSNETTTLTVNDAAGPFRVSSQRGSNIIWGTGATEIITWDVANTDDVAGVNSQNMDILLSTDGGLNFNTVLVSNTPNDGSQNITVPNSISANARIMIRAADNVFFDINEAAIEITATPSCTNARDMLVDNVLDDAAVISWLASQSNPSSGYDYIVNTTGTTPTAGATPTATLAQGVTSVTLSSLTANTTYYFYIRANCSDGDVSNWSIAVSFRTTCAAISAPLVENFDGANWVNNGAVDTCWQRTPRSPNYAWGVRSGTTPTVNTGPSDDVTGGGKYLYTEQSGSSGTTYHLDDEAILSTPPIDLSALTFPEMKISYHMFGSSMGTMKVEVKEINAITYNTVFSISGQQQTTSAAPFIEQTIDLSAYAGQSVHMRFIGVRGSNFDSAIAIDQFIIEETTGCAPPENLTVSNLMANSADLSWDTIGNAFNGYQWVVLPAGLAPDPATAIAWGVAPAGTTTAQATGLSESTDYDAYVRTNCGATGLSNWSLNTNFRTSCVSPENLTVSNLTANSADLSWGTIGNATDGYEWVLMPAGLAPYPATAIATGTVATGITTAQASGLAQYTDYDAYVRTNCGATGLSSWSLMTNFRTSCGIVSPVATCSPNATSTGSSGILSVGLNGVTFYSGSSAHDGGNIDKSANCGSYFEIDVEVNNILNVGMFSVNGQQLGIWIDWNDDGDFEDDAEQQYLVAGGIEAGSTIQHQLIYPADIPYNDYVRIRLITDVSSQYGGVSAIDSACFTSLVYGQSEDYAIFVKPSCAPPENPTVSNLTANSADLSWGNIGNATDGYEWVVMASGVAPDPATAIATGTVATGITTAQATGLYGSTDYDAYVRTNCAAIGLWSLMTNFRTSCVPPENLTVSNLPANSADLSWGTIGNPNDGYEWMVMASGLAPDPATAIATGTVATGITTAQATGLAQYTDYDVYVRTNCGATGLSAWSGVVSFFTGYCAAAATNGNFESISNVTFNTINNNSTANAVYEDFTSIATPISRGQEYSFNASFAGISYDTDQVIVWIDFNQDLDFEDAGERVLITSPGSSPWTGTITIPLTAVLGKTMMRIRLHDPVTNYGPNSTPCGNSGYGQVEDYTVVIYDDYVYYDGAWTPTDPSGVSTATDNVLVVDGSPTLAGTTISETLTILPFKSLNIEGVLEVTGDIENNGVITFKSNATETGQFGPFTGTISGSGNVIVERFIPGKRAFRFVTSAVNTTTSIRANWQEGVNNTTTDANNDPNPGFGTHISGDLNGANGFDATSTGNASLFTFSNIAQSWNTATSTDAITLAAGDPYRLYVRGSRAVDLNGNASIPDPTTLRTTGALVTGNVSQSSFNPSSGAFNLFGNPYQSSVDMNQTLQASTNINANFYYVWDPQLGDRGSYATVMLPAGSNTSLSGANQYLQPGQAAFVATQADGAASMLFQEVHKAVGQRTATFSTPAASSSIIGQLFRNENGTIAASMQDSYGLFFSSSANNGIDSFDALKLSNQDETIAVQYGTDFLAVDNRQLPQNNETIQLSHTAYRAASYQYKIDITNVIGKQVFLEDAFSGTSTLLNEGVNLYNFTVDASTGSSASDRFSLAIENETLGLGDQELESNITMFPNPVGSDMAQISLSGYDMEGEVKATIYNLSGQRLYDYSLEVSNGITLIKGLSRLATGAYLLEITTAQHAQTIKFMKR